MGLQALVYYVWRISRAQQAAVSGTPWDGAAAATPAADQPLPGLPRNPYRIRYKAKPHVGALPLNESAPVIAETSASTPRNPYRIVYRDRWHIGTPAYDQSGPVVQPDSLGASPSPTYRTVYKPFSAIRVVLGAEAFDESTAWEPLGNQPRRIFQIVYNEGKRAQPFAGTAAYDETYQDALGSAPRPTYRVLYDPRRALREVLGAAAYDDSFVAAAAPDSSGSTPRNVYARVYNSARATSALLGRTAFDDSVVTPGGVGVYIPVIRRRRR